jgi:hypothetical protein
MSISFEEAIASLQAMFVDWDRDSLHAILEANNYHVERAVEQCLAMSGDESAKTEVKNRYVKY